MFLNGLDIGGLKGLKIGYAEPAATYGQAIMVSSGWATSKTENIRIVARSLEIKTRS